MESTSYNNAGCGGSVRRISVHPIRVCTGSVLYSIVDYAHVQQSYCNVSIPVTSALWILLVHVYVHFFFSFIYHGFLQFFIFMFCCRWIIIGVGLRIPFPIPFPLLKPLLQHTAIQAAILLFHMILFRESVRG